MGLGGSRQTALVTGAAGFLGSHLCDRLLNDGFEVIGLDNLMTGDLTNLSSAMRERRFHFQLGDVREPLPAYAQIVFNLASPASPVHYQSDPYATFTSNVLGALRLVELAKGRRCTIVHASTSEIYGDPNVHPQPESYWGHVNPVGPRACYDEGKRAAETLFADARRHWHIDARVVRIFNTYGPRMALNDGRVVTSFITAALRGAPLEIYGNGAQTRSFCFVSDLIEGLVLVARRAPLGGAINLGNPSEITVMDLALEVLRATGSRSQISHAPLPSDDPRQRRPDISLATNHLGFEPRVSLQVGLRATIEDLRARVAERSASADLGRSDRTDELTSMAK